MSLKTQPWFESLSWRNARPDAEGNIPDSFLQTINAVTTNTICPLGPIRAPTSELAAA